MIIHWTRRQYHRAQRAFSESAIGVWFGAIDTTPLDLGVTSVRSLVPARTVTTLTPVRTVRSLED